MAVKTKVARQWGRFLVVMGFRSTIPRHDPSKALIATRWMVGSVFWTVKDLEFYVAILGSWLQSDDRG